MGKPSRIRDAVSSLAFPVAVCMGAMGYNHLLDVNQAEAGDTFSCGQGASAFGDNASVAQSGISSVSTDEAILSYPVTQDYTTHSSQNATTSTAHSIKSKSGPTDRIHGVLLKNSSPLFESIRRRRWKLTMSLLQKSSISCNVAPKQEDEDEQSRTMINEASHMVPPLELIKTWTSMQDANDIILWRRLPLHEALCREAPADLVYTLLDVYPLAAKAADSEGNLPLHLVMEHTLGPAIFQRIFNQHPQAMETTNHRGQLPLQCLQIDATDTGAVSSTRGQVVLQQYFNSAKQVAHHNVPKLKKELFQVNKTIEAVKSELRLAKLELSMVKQHKRLTAERKLQEDSNMKEEVLQLRSELETLRCEREQLAAEKEMWTDKCKQQQSVVEDVLSSEGNYNGWIANEFNEMMSELEHTSQLVHRKAKGTSDLFSAKFGDITKAKNKASSDGKLNECNTDTTEMSYDAATEQQSSSEEDGKPPARKLSEGNSVGSRTELSILPSKDYEPDAIESTRDNPFENDRNVAKREKTTNEASTGLGAIAVSRDKGDASSPAGEDRIPIGMKKSLSNQREEADETLEEIKSSDSWVQFIKASKADDPDSRRQRFESLWKSNAMADDLANHETVAEKEDTEEESEAYDHLGPLVTAKLERSKRINKKKKENQKKRALNEKRSSPGGEKRDEDNSEGRDKKVAFAREDAVIEEDSESESFLLPFDDIDEAIDEDVDTTLSKLPNHTSNSNYSCVSRSHQYSPRRNRIQSRSRSKSIPPKGNINLNINVSREDTIKFMASAPQKSFDESSSRSIATTMESYGRQLTLQDSSAGL